MKKHAKKIITALLVIAMLVPTVAMLVTNAATSFTVELAFDNLFVFDHWVTNGNSMIIDNDFGSTNAGSITDIDLENGSFRFNNNTNHNIYTRAAAGTGEKTQENFDYYRMPVEEGATYTFSCNFTGTSPAFYPYVFFYTESNEFTGQGHIVNGSFSGEGDHAFNFTVPAGAKYIQLRLVIGGNDASNAYAVIKDISISKYEFELDTNNLFSLDSWVGSEKSDQLASWANYDDGKVTPQDSNSDGSYDKLYFETNTDSAETSGNLFTNFDYSSNSGYYSIDVDPNTTYTLSYNISAANALHFKPYIVRYKANGAFIDYIGEQALAYGVGNFTFTTTSETEYISVVFSIEHQNQNWNLTLQDIGVYKAYITNYTVDPVRKTYTYNSSNTATYGTLPTPPAETYPENYIFAGWYTEKDGKGTRIAADTEIIPQSMTVYPKFEPAVDTLTVKTPPTKTTYTVGEKLNTTGLVLTYGIETVVDSQTVIKTTDISSGFYITPEYAQTTAGTQTITAHYGGKTATFEVTVTDGDEKNIVVNGAAYPVKVANNEYTLNYTASAFNRYEMTYFSDSYVKGEIVMDGVTEEFFLEPSSNGTFASYIDSFLRGVNHYNVESIKFTCLDKEFGNFELLSVTTIAAAVPSSATQYYENAETGYKVGIDLSFGGVVSEIYDLNNIVESRVYTINGQNVTKVDYAARLDADYGTNYISRKTENVNLINKFDRGRYLQQSYYGTSQKPYEMGDYNGNPWPYNPVQGGNLVINNADGTTKGNEASKVIDYRITNEQIYIKTRPLDWGKNSVDYPDSYVTDSYMEAWYVFEDGMIKTYCRFVDYSGYPSHTRDQELPAVYIIEPLNHFVYNDVAKGSEWTTTNYKKTEEPDFWGVLPSYNSTLAANGMPTVDPTVDCYENWAAFTASDNAESFGVGVYSAGVTDFHYGCFFPKYQEEAANNGRLVATPNRHAVTTDPATENPTSYISPVDDMTFESYKPIEYSYYLTTGTADQIYADFKAIATKENQADLDKAKIAVPETVYMTPADGASKVGQYYVNNILDSSNNYNIVTEAERDAGMYLGLHVKDAATFSVKITNVTDPSNDIFLCNTSGSEISESTRISFDATDTYTNSTSYGLRFSGTGLNPGEKATAKWEITVYLDGGATETHTAYTVLYAPGRTVGAVAEARQVDASQNEISSWITGANGVDHTKRSPLGSFHGDMHNSGYFKADPLYSSVPTSGSGGTANDYIVAGTDYDDNSYVLQTATNGHDGSRAQSYLGLLTVDKSRYSNTNQIPNLSIGYDALRKGSYTNNSIGEYTTYYTLGTNESYTATSLSAAPSGWTTYSGKYTDFASNHDIPYRESFVPSFDVSTIDGKYIHALNQAKADQTLNTNQYSTAGTSVLCSVTDKSGLRDAVMNGYALPEEDYTEDSYNKFLEELEDAATVLGDPSATQEEINNAKDDLNNVISQLTEVYYALKYDNLFSAYEFSQHPVNMTTNVANATVSYNAGTITVNSNGTEKADVYSNYDNTDNSYLVELEPNTAYVYEYDVVSDKGSQAFLFFYDAATRNGVQVTNRSVQTGSGAPITNTETTVHFGNYTHGVGGNNHYVIRFTTPSSAIKIGFRFGNVDDTTVESTFSNIRLIEESKYYPDATYSQTEAVYKEFASYGTLITPVRPSYTFGGWVDAAGNTVTGADIATEHKSIFSVWTENRYTIVYNANGGSGSTASQTVTYTQSVTLDAGTNFSKSGSKLIGWATTSNATSAQYKLGQTVSGLTDVNNGTVTLYAVWASAEVNITFDNLIDFKSWNKTTASNGTISDITDTGFTITTKTGAGEGTSESPEFPVTGGKQYMIDIDFVGDGWDVYIFFRNATQGGTGIDFSDGNNRFSSNGTGNASQIFTAPASATKAVIRLDSNGSGNIVSYNNIRVYEYDGISPIEVDTANKIVNGGSTFGDLPTPTKEGFTFLGWFDENGNQVTAASIVNDTDSNGVVPLTSKWQLADTALGNDSAVIDFGTSLAIDADANDTIFNKAATAYGATGSILGISTDGSSYASTANGSYGTFKLENGNIVYTPTSAVNDAETVYYRAQLSSGDTTVVKSKLTVAPASNVLYEESLFKTNTAVAGVDWKTDGTPGTINQDASTTNDVYGYDSNVNGYNKIVNYSNGSAYKVSVDETNKRSKIMSFTFTGEGFDLNSACGPNTGVQIVTLKDNTNNKMVKSYIVDTYYNDANYGDADSKILYQVPIISENALDYSNYTIQVVASYLPSMSGALNTAAVETQTVDGMTVNTTAADSAALREALAEVGLEYVLDAEAVDVVWFDDNSVLNGGMGVDTLGEETLRTAAVTSLLNVVDSVRVYKPIEDGNSYYIDSETNAQYINVMDNLVNPTEGGAITGSGNYFAYISGKTDEENIVLDTYKEIGPKDELYLSKAPSDERAITFTIKDFDKAAAVMISLRAASGTPTVKIGSYQFAVKSNTEMYYDITKYVAEDGTVTIQNMTEGTLLAIGSLKITSEVVGTAALSTEFNLMTARTMMMAVAEDVDPNAPDAEPEEPVIPDDPVNPEDPPADGNSSECWLIRFFKWVVEMFVNIFNLVKGIFGF